MDASRSVHIADSRSDSLIACTATHTNLIAQLRTAASQLAEGRINRRTKWKDGRKIDEFFCMDCQCVQVEGEPDAHLAWCKTGRVLAVLTAIEESEKAVAADGPGVDGFTPLYSAEINPVEIACLEETACGTRVIVKAGAR